QRYEKSACNCYSRPARLRSLRIKSAASGHPADIAEDQTAKIGGETPPAFRKTGHARSRKPYHSGAKNHDTPT
ncbi:hypothetical protein, partial [Alistipes finegoldii]|uniref:hypothetical protein n=1 Tax=Alistipes finegoldii TaxID=214856 RepID=UPI00242B8ECA